MKQLILLNTSILTSYGTFEYQPLTLDEARNLAGKTEEIISAIGHQPTAGILSDLLEFEVENNRIDIRQEIGQTALVFKLKGRVPEGTILNRDEIEAMGYEFGLLRRLK